MLVVNQDKNMERRANELVAEFKSLDGTLPKFRKDGRLKITLMCPKLKKLLWNVQNDVELPRTV